VKLGCGECSSAKQSSIWAKHRDGEFALAAMGWKNVRKKLLTDDFYITIAKCFNKAATKNDFVKGEERYYISYGSPDALCAIIDSFCYFVVFAIPLHNCLSIKLRIVQYSL
jgi:hypothetical protein